LPVATENPGGVGRPQELAVVISFALHSFAALIVSPIIVFIVAIAAAVIFNNSPRINSTFNVGGVVSPFVWLPGLLLGLFMNWIALKRTAYWVWIVGVAWMVCGILASLHYYQYQWQGTCPPLEGVMNEFFFVDARRCGGTGTILNSIDFTWPMFNSIAYSIGAWAAVHLGNRSNRRNALQ
jgi:hypothetical protein